MKSLKIIEEFDGKLFTIITKDGTRYSYFDKGMALDMLKILQDREEFETKIKREKLNPCSLCSNCFFFCKLQDMGASIPYCSLDKDFSFKFFYFSNSKCEYYIHKDKAYKLVFDLVKARKDK